MNTMLDMHVIRVIYVSNANTEPARLRISEEIAHGARRVLLPTGDS